MQIQWVLFHGMLTHFPIALIFTALAFEIGALLFKQASWRTVSFWMIVSAAVYAAPSVVTGLLAAPMMFGSRPPTTLVDHRLFGYATLVLTSVAALIRFAQRRNADDPAAVRSSMVFLLLAAAAAGYTGYLGGGMVFAGGSASAAGIAPAAVSSVQTPIEPSALISQGQAAFASNNCESCHSINGVGGRFGPNLTQEGLRHPDTSWQIQHLKNPASVSPGSNMPPYDDLSDAQLKALAAFLVTRR